MSKQEQAGATDTENHAWVIDSLVQFLSGPVWNKPIAAFIEKKSTIFEPDVEQDTPEHRSVHQEYRNLVDSLLGGFVEELHISPIQFQQAVSSDGTGQSTLARFQPGALLEQVWAASDFVTFSRLMGLRNLELQLQALDAIRNRGNTPLALEVFADDGTTDAMGGEERLLKHVLRRSMEEASIVERMKKFNRLSLAETSPADSKILTFTDDEKKNHVPDDYTIALELKKEREVKEEPVFELKAEKKVHNEQQHLPSVTALVTANLTEAEIQKRKDYLCQQRDRLLRAKGRSKQAPSTETRSVAATKEEGSVTPEPAATEQALQLRRALVNRLKAEVINKH